MRHETLGMRHETLGMRHETLGMRHEPAHRSDWKPVALSVFRIQSAVSTRN
jgi:hypothetical protein